MPSNTASKGFLIAEWNNVLRWQIKHSSTSSFLIGTVKNHKAIGS